MLWLGVEEKAGAGYGKKYCKISSVLRNFFVHMLSGAKKDFPSHSVAAYSNQSLGLLKLREVTLRQPYIGFRRPRFWLL